MCLAIYKPAGFSIPTEHLRAGFINNPHGAGFAYAKDGVVVIRKGFFTSFEFLAAYEKEVLPEMPVLVHFRWATHGKRNKFNCHPWPVCGGEFAAVHNGIINIQSTNKKSDTGHFIDLVLTPALEAFSDPSHPALKFMVEETVGSHNKVVVMSGSGEVTIYNEKSGEWNGGVWYSNSGYEFASYRYKYGRASDTESYLYGGADAFWDEEHMPAQSTRNNGGKRKPSLRLVSPGVYETVSEDPTLDEAYSGIPAYKADQDQLINDLIEENTVVVGDDTTCCTCGGIINAGTSAYNDELDGLTCESCIGIPVH